VQQLTSDTIIEVVVL